MIGDHTGPSTHISLIQRVRQSHNQHAWAEFVERYGPTILRWCRKWCKQDADTRDVSQDILLRVWKKMPDFRYESGGSFRGWLRRVSKNIFLDSVRRKRPELIHDDVVEAEMERHAIEFANSMEEVFDLELLNLVLAQVKPLVEPWRWELFELNFAQGQDAKVIAEQYGKSVAMVRMNNLRIRTQVTERIRAIEASLDIGGLLPC